MICRLIEPDNVASPLNGPGYERIQDGLRIAIVSPGELRQAMM
jgi:hypothetical protein